MGQKNTGNCIDVHLTPISQSRCHGSTGIIMTKTLASVYLSIVIDLLMRNHHKSCRKYPFLQLPNLQVLLLSEPRIKRPHELQFCCRTVKIVLCFTWPIQTSIVITRTHLQRKEDASKYSILYPHPIIW